ncbi:MAG: hypothetical protein HN976_34110 [Lentisphaerae bacterium]|nr:hypothetical protein [Lentisphaerota bacterium]MBT7060182.1 hypothetical protein [Lentisphaerota bacterium]
MIHSSRFRSDQHKHPGRRGIRGPRPETTDVPAPERVPQVAGIAAAAAQHAVLSSHFHSIRFTQHIRQPKAVASLRAKLSTGAANAYPSDQGQRAEPGLSSIAPFSRSWPSASRPPKQNPVWESAGPEK